MIAAFSTEKDINMPRLLPMKRIHQGRPDSVDGSENTGF